QGETPERFTEFERDAVGRLVAKENSDARQDYEYDIADRLLKIHRTPTWIGKRIGVSEETLNYEYDILGRLVKEATTQGCLGYEYDPLHNLTTLTLPDGRKVNHLYYGSGHLHQLNIDGQVISDFERDDLHREVYRTQGNLTSCFGYDAMGRKQWHYATTVPSEKFSMIPDEVREYLYIDPRAVVKRRYSYDPAGELIKTMDLLRGEFTYAYEKNGQLHSRDTGNFLDSEEFRYDAAANRLNHGTSQFDQVRENRLKKLSGVEFDYDPWGNLITKSSGNHLVNQQRFEYDAENRLVHAQTWGQGHLVSEGWYQYDSLGRRTKKKAQEQGSAEQKEKVFLWQGLRMLQEQTPTAQVLYLYEPNSYVPLARIDDTEGQEQKRYYFHNDQIGTPLEMTDAEGRIVWQATYRSWGEVQSLAVGEVEQNLRFQGQYFDIETELYYNTFRYYDSLTGRFTTQDPIGLEGGNNLYRYVPNPTAWIDPWGWECWSTARKNYWKAEAKVPSQTYSPANMARMSDGKAPKMKVEVVSRITDIKSIKDVSLELHHDAIPQRIGGAGVHASSNLLSLTPWEHEAVDSFRHVGSDLVRVIRGVDVW
ncbi:RHS repeat-associated core domain-containing protein, partial [Pseudomonas sp. dw_358]|uniref:RHS repeat-associated core domain-containing protein n=1 Tax=Pseudomonas sp. dw_358 TaxID=2720083 RepID=UPI001BD36715